MEEGQHAVEVAGRMPYAVERTDEVVHCTPNYKSQYLDRSLCSLNGGATN